MQSERLVAAPQGFIMLEPSLGSMNGEENTDSFAEQFEKVHNHLDLVDRTLEEMADEIQSEINAAMDEAEIKVSYDIDTGSFEAQFPISQITARLNQRLDPPFFVHEDDGSIVVGDVRREISVDVDDIRNSASNRDRIKSIKQIISKLEEENEEGASEGHVITLLQYCGLDEETTISELEKLKEKGEVYTPSSGHLRTT